MRWISLALAVGALFGGLTLLPAEPRALETPPTEAPDRAGHEPGNPEDLEAFFDDLISGQLREERVAGATVSVVDDGRLVFAKGYGYADVERREPVVADRTLFYPGSAGKLFTWTAVMQLAEEGKLDLDADVETYLDFEIPATHPEPITMRHLMTHTAGFEEQPAALFVEDRQAVLPLRDFLVRYMPARVYTPGEFFAYSNYGTALAGYVVERVSGTPYERYVTDRILEPLGMERSTATQPLPETLADDFSKGYHYRGGGYVAGDFEWLAAVPVAPVRATATDMASFMLAHLGKGEHGDARILREDTALEMHREHFTHDPRLPGLAYGFPTSRENGRYVIWHNGESPHFTTMLALLPEEGTGLFVSYNTPLDPRPTLSAFLDHYYPTQEEEAVSSRPPPGFEARAAQWTGTYVPTRVAYTGPHKIIGWLSPVKVSAGERGLLLRTPIGDQRYTEVDRGLLRQEDGERLLTFREDEQGRVTHALWGPFAYAKVPWYRTLGFQLPLVGACAAVLGSTLVVFPVEYLLRRRHRGVRPPPTARAARWLAGTTAALDLALMIWFVAILLRFAESYVWPTATVSTITLLWSLSVPLTLGVVILSVVAWRNTYWGIAGRVHYTLVALAAIVLLVSLMSWNLIGA